MWKNNNSNKKMHGLSEIGPNVPAFLVKLWKLVEDPECDLIYWSESGMSFIIVAQARFAREVLPLHYKHNNMASFIRQLNMYDFHKIASVESGGLKSDKDEMEFAHQYFIKDHPYLLENIKRKLSNPKSGVVTADQFSTNNVKNGSQSDIFAKVLSDVNILKGKQESWDARLSAMKRENEALWRELAVFRQKHLKQEQIINRLIHFIVTIVQPSRKVPLRRRFPLMLNDTQQVKKLSKLNGSSGGQLSHGSPTGTTIHEIDSDVLTTNDDKNERVESIEDTDFISTDFSGSPNEFVEVVSPAESQVVNNPVVTTNSSSVAKKGNPSDWLEIVLTEDDMITNPLTPIDPAKVNPTMAAATLKHLESNNKITTPITIKIPSIFNSESGKKTIPEKKIIYLTDVKKANKIAKKRHPRQGASKIELSKTKGSPQKKNGITAVDTTEALLDMDCDEGTSTSKMVTVPAKSAASGKRKLPLSNSPTALKTQTKRPKFQNKSTVQAASEPYQSLLTPDTLENSLKCNFSDLEAAEHGGGTCDNGGEKQSASEDSFWKLESLYNGSIGVNELVSEVDEEENPIDEKAEEPKNDFIIRDEKSSNINLCDIDASDIELSKLSPKNEAESNESVVDFPPESMAVVCQSPSQTCSNDLSRHLTSHVDSVQDEIDYLKEVLKGEGYNLDVNNILGYFNEDPLSYGMLPPAEEESKEKENEKSITGNEVITYGTPNLMDLVDLFGSTGTVQDWSSVMSPISPTVSELTTPAPSPSPSTLAKSAKRRKI